ncbi:TSA 417 [Symbiodinium pilosum]|uniref:TSA 417 protein n=1 Tax=Symbiodinium pilosum TaxID=2952 RepID=A0A812UE88_SYMPI|nr:TSA 417 [Symbiodinium pilosum]
MLASIHPADWDVVAVGTLASTLAKGACWSHALQLLEMVKPTVVVMGAVISACERTHRWIMALETQML